MKGRWIKFFAIAIVVLCSPYLSLRADDSVGSLRLEYWNFAVKGNATVLGSPGEIDDTSKLISGTNHGFVFGGERKFDGWGVMMDVSVSKQSATKQLTSSDSVEAESSSTMIGGAAFHSFVDEEFEGTDRTLRLDGLAGLRGYVNYYKLTFNPFDPNNNQDRSDEVNWVDPILGLNIRAALNSKLALELYGDVGGFGVGSASEHSVLTRASVVWSITSGFHLIGGYRLFDLKSGDQSGDRKTELDLQMRGFTLGIEGKF